MTINSNQFNQEATAKFETFFEGVDSEIISEGAKAVIMTTPTKWAQYVEEAVFTYIKVQLDDVEERGMFIRTFQNLHEKIAMHTSLAQFVDWLQVEKLGFIFSNGSLELNNKDALRCEYEVLDLFTKFLN